MRLNLSACPPFSFWAVVESHGWVRLPPFAADRGAGVLTRIERLEGGRVVELVIREAVGGVTVEVHEQLSGLEREEVSRKVWWMLGLGENLAPFYALAREEPKLAHVERQALGRMLRSPSVFEDLVKTLLTINTTWTGTIRMVEAVVSHFGDPLPTDPSRNAFPTPAQLAVGTEADLREVGLGYRAPFVAELARRVVEGELGLEGLKDSDRPTEEVCKSLLSIRGVGEYAAAALLMLLGRYDYVPVDTWARKLVSREWYGGRPVGRKEVETAFERWGRWKGLAYWFWDWALWEEEP
ncbi:MAG TPA: endonuclease III domain-containing protein [Chloroflexi bacterium]|nr:endonuclease III domain-containing protein [Chloroflexota bacterium]